jgi:hypothetical protein
MCRIGSSQNWATKECIEYRKRDWKCDERKQECKSGREGLIC